MCHTNRHFEWYREMYQDMLNNNCIGGRTLPYLKMVENIRPIDPRIAPLRSCWVPFFNHCKNPLFPRWGGALPYFKLVRNFFTIAPHFCHFLISLDPIYAKIDRTAPPPLCTKKSVSLTHLVLDIIAPKVGQFFHQNLSFESFEAFCTNSFIDFRSS